MNSPAAVRRIVIVNLENGLHMVPCSEIAKFVRDYTGQVSIRRDQYAADAHSILDLLQLKAECGTTLTIEAEGDGAEQVVEGLSRLFAANFQTPLPPVPESGASSP
jgi:phosphotransferase system HPr (HPr) family protein